MDENRNNTAATDEEEGGIDIMAMLRSLWDGRKTILICIGIFIFLGLLSALTMKRSYSVTTVMVPQMGDNKSGLGGLAALAGFDMGSASNNGELSPLVYPQIVSSVPFQLQMMHAPMHYEKCDTLISMFDYAQAKYEKPTVFDVVKRYTIGLPGVILGAMKGKEKEVVLPGMGEADSTGVPKPLVVSMDEYKMLAAVDQIITLNVDKKEGIITLIANAGEPLLAAERAMKAQQLLQDEVTRFRIEKSQSELDYIQARYNEAKEEADRYQMALAGTRDRMQNVVTSSSTVGRERLQSKYNVANTVYLEMAKQLEQAKMKVKKDTPAFSIIQPVSVPMKPSNSRAKTLIIWTFLGIVLGCGIVLAKGYWPKLKEKFQKPAEEEK